MLTMIASFILVLGVLVFIHEFGHFIVAKRLGVRVEKFSLGFGPKLWGFRRKETEYLLSLLPLGGYVKLAGENPEEAHGHDPSEFSSRSPGDRAKIVLAGPIMNLVLGFALFPLVFMIGTEIPKYFKEPPLIGWVEHDSPASEAGFLPGDRILTIDGTGVATWEKLENLITANPTRPLAITFERTGEILEKTLTPRANEAYGTGYAGLVYPIAPIVGGVAPRSPAKHAGLKEGDRILSVNDVPVSHWFQIPELIQRGGEKEVRLLIERENQQQTFSLTPRIDARNGSTRPSIGITLSLEVVIERYGVIESLQRGTLKAAELVGMTFVVLKRLVCAELPVKTLGGPIMIAQITGEAAKAGFSKVLFLMAFLSLNLAVLNLLPIPVLDGGHVLFLFIEFLRGKPLGVKKMEIAQQIGLALLLILMVVVTYNDLHRIFPWNIEDYFPWK
jgi:regulator of sigma E protease